MVGVIDLLDEECKLPKGSTQHFTDSVYSKHREHFRLNVRGWPSGLLGFPVDHCSRFQLNWLQFETGFISVGLSDPSPFSLLSLSPSLSVAPQV